MPGLANPRNNNVGSRRLLPAEIYPGAILWMPAPDDRTKLDIGKFNHPVVVLFVGGTGPGYSAALMDHIRLVEDDEVLVVGVTTFGGTFLSEHFAAHSNPEYRRRGYIPLQCIPPMPHPDTGLILETQCLRDRPSMVDTQSYVALEPFRVPKRGLIRLKDGRIELKKPSLQLLEREIEARESRGRHDTMDISTVISSPGIPNLDEFDTAVPRGVASRYGIPPREDMLRGNVVDAPPSVYRQQPTQAPSVRQPRVQAQSRLPPPLQTPAYIPQYTPPRNYGHTAFENRPLLDTHRYGNSQNARAYGTSPLADRAPRAPLTAARYGHRHGFYGAEEAAGADSPPPEDELTIGDLLALGLKLCVAGVCGFVLAKWFDSHKK